MEKYTSTYKLYLEECRWDSRNPDDSGLWDKMYDRFENIKAMNTIVKSINDESAYFNHWIYIVPDDALDEDFMGLAFDDETFTDAVDCFKLLMTNYIASKKRSLYIGEVLY